MEVTQRRYRKEDMKDRQVLQFVDKVNEEFNFHDDLMKECQAVLFSIFNDTYEEDGFVKEVKHKTEQKTSRVQIEISEREEDNFKLEVIIENKDSAVTFNWHNGEFQAVTSTIDGADDIGNFDEEIKGCGLFEEDMAS